MFVIGQICDCNQVSLFIDEISLTLIEKANFYAIQHKHF